MINYLQQRRQECTMKKYLFKSGTGKTEQLHVKSDFRTFPYNILKKKKNSKCIKDLNVKYEAIKFLEENIGRTLFGNIFSVSAY